MANNKPPRKNLVRVPNRSGIGAPTVYTPEVGEKICDLIATTSMGLRKICQLDDIPPHLTVTKWLLDDDHPFTTQYMRAKEQQAEVLGDQIISIPDDCKPDSKFSIEKAKLQVDARKFVAAKLKPKRWGDRIIKEISGTDGQPIKIETAQLDLSALNEEELLQFKALTEKMNKKSEDK
jgi:hypothetical protein